jgi:serine/threonine protein phosphatase PrpC
MRLKVGAGTHTGRVRALNEDAYMLRADEGLFVVCDGMGGAPAGEVASQMAVDAIRRELHDAAPATSECASGGRGFLPHTTRLAEVVRRSNGVIYDQAHKNPRQAGMGTTVVGAWIRQHIVSIAHVGDSRAYLWHGDRLEPLTRDHSLGEAHIAAGLIEEVRRLTVEQQNALVRVLGREPDVDVDVKEVPVRPGNYVLLCSDGLTRMVPEYMLARAFHECRQPQRICDFLIAAANDNGGADNITVVVVQVTGGWWRRFSNRWTRSARRNVMSGFPGLGEAEGSRTSREVCRS